MLVRLPKRSNIVYHLCTMLYGKYIYKIDLIHYKISTTALVTNLSIESYIYIYIKKNTHT